ncbi:hypothetical protein L6164_017426 [Bauhinia variegata]|uniref:Uncharacterized protein n=1 Tax=Bauhinia variegata TaxID=167791 RepID=A0ACB9NCV0_BAUVA|nr:hypothetical protein L6164_017426 [Bauhinia variegata]
MILVAIVAEVLEEYTVLLARVVEQLFRSAPLPRRVRFLILHSLPSGPRPRPQMILVAIVAEVLEEYTMLLAGVVEQLFRSAPLPRRVRVLILHSLPSGPHPRLIRAPA